jgi:hypothetical protein
VTGAFKQVNSATNMVRKSGIMTQTLNVAQKGISGTLGVVGDVTSSVIKVSSGVAGSTIGEFGKLVDRMTSGSETKPTPLDSYVGMVLKDNPVQSSMA